MSGFLDTVAADNQKLMDTREFAVKRTILYDGVTYEDIPVVLSSIKEKNRRQLISDHVQGLYLVSLVVQCLSADLGGVVPEKGQSLKINDTEGSGGFFSKYTIATSACELGMLRIGLEAIDE